MLSVIDCRARNYALFYPDIALVTSQTSRGFVRTWLSPTVPVSNVRVFNCQYVVALVISSLM